MVLVLEQVQNLVLVQGQDPDLVRALELAQELVQVEQLLQIKYREHWRVYHFPWKTLILEEYRLFLLLMVLYQLLRHHILIKLWQV